MSILDRFSRYRVVPWSFVQITIFISSSAIYINRFSKSQWRSQVHTGAKKWSLQPIQKLYYRSQKSAIFSDKNFKTYSANFVVLLQGLVKKNHFYAGHWNRFSSVGKAFKTSSADTGVSFQLMSSNVCCDKSTSVNSPLPGDSWLLAQ